MDEQTNPALEAGEPPIVEAEAVAADTTEGQVDSQPAEAEPEGDAEDKSRSKERRERRKAAQERLAQERDAAVQRLERLRKAAESDAEPKETEFADLTEYSIAKAAWQLSRKSVAREEREVMESVAAAEAERQRLAQQSYEDSVAEARSRYADFDAVVQRGGYYVAEPVARMVMESDVSADLAYRLASDPELATAISQTYRTAPLEAARMLGRLEANITAPPRRTETRAPEPIKPVSARNPAAPNPDKMTMAEYRAWRARQAS